MGVKNIIMISIDALRFDCVGYQKDKRFLDRHGVKALLDTTALDSLAGKGVSFTQAVSTASYTTNSHASIFTGCYPPLHNVRAFFSTRLSPSIKTVAEILKENQYRTMHYFDGAYMFQSTGLTRGVDIVADRSDDEDFFERLKGRGDRKTFLFVHFFDVHDPYIFSHQEQKKHGVDGEYENWKEEVRKRYGIEEGATKRPYDSFHAIRKRLVEMNLAHEVLIPAYIRGVTRFLNGRFTNFIKGLKETGILTDDSLLVVFSDHGEACYGADFTHGGLLIEDVIRIPLFFSCPAEIPENKTIDTQISTVDILPTILDMAGIHPRDKALMQGRTLLPLINGDGQVYRTSPAYSEYWSETIDADLMRQRTLEGRGGILGEGHTRDKRWQQSLRTPEHKFIFNNNPAATPEMETVLKETEGLSTDEFIKKAYRKILLRETDPGGFQNAKAQIEHGLERGQFLNALYASLEYKNLNGDIMVDLRHLRDEEKWIDISESFYSKYWDAKKIVNEICSITPKDEEKIIFTDSDEEQKVMDRLKDLGYME